MPEDDLPNALHIEVVYALSDRQAVVSLRMTDGARVRDAVAESGILQSYPELVLNETPVGIYGVRAEYSTPLRDGDRVELYRPLLIDPMQARRARARSQAETKQ
ncbi:hypothetical protein AB833_19660 [Chromatiales bacterium (ex Bugula neritina AB1)]|nr:hypothetical protein AB833_19660 [Chromatiales bacterium (ex Bugula neritina AB1)]